MTAPIQRLVERDITRRREIRRGTILTPPRLVNFDTAGIGRSVFVVDVDTGASRPLRNVIVKSSTGLGAREYAQVNKAVEIQRNAGGRWIVIGPSDRIRSTAGVTELDESDDTTSAGVLDGFSTAPRFFSFWAINGGWGSAGFGDTRIFDGAGNEVL